MVRPICIIIHTGVTAECTQDKDRMTRLCIANTACQAEERQGQEHWKAHAGGPLSSARCVLHSHSLPAVRLARGADSWLPPPPAVAPWPPPTLRGSPARAGALQRGPSHTQGEHRNAQVTHSCRVCYSLVSRALLTRVVYATRSCRVCYSVVSCMLLTRVACVTHSCRVCYSLVSCMLLTRVACATHPYWLVHNPLHHQPTND